MNRKLEIELTSVEVLEIVCLINVQTFAETVEGQMAKNRFRRLQINLQKQLAEKSTIEELNDATEEITSYLNPFEFPEFIQEK